MSRRYNRSLRLWLLGSSCRRLVCPCSTSNAGRVARSRARPVSAFAPRLVSHVSRHQVDQHTGKGPRSAPILCSIRCRQAIKSSAASAKALRSASLILTISPGLYFTDSQTHSRIRALMARLRVPSPTNNPFHSLSRSSSLKPALGSQARKAYVRSLV